MSLQGHCRPTNPELSLAHFRLAPKADVRLLRLWVHAVAKLPRRFDRVAIAQTLRHALVRAAGVDHGIDQPHTDADDDHEEHEQHQIAAPAVVAAFLFRRLLVHFNAPSSAPWSPSPAPPAA